MAIDAELLRVFQEVAQQMRGQSAVLSETLKVAKSGSTRDSRSVDKPTDKGSSPKARAAEMRQEKALQVFNGAQSAFNAALKSVSDIDLDSIPKTLSQTLEQSNSKFVRAMSDNVKSLADVINTQDQAKALHELTAAMRSSRQGEITDLEFLLKFKKSVNETGLDLSKLGYSMEDIVRFAAVNQRAAKVGIDNLSKTQRKLYDESQKALENLNSEAGELADRFEKAGKQMTDTSTSMMSKVGKGLGILGKFLAPVAVAGFHLGKELKEAGDAANKFGVETRFGAFQLGMVPEELIQLTAANKKVVNAMGGTEEWLRLMGGSTKTVVESMEQMGMEVPDALRKSLGAIPSDLPENSHKLSVNFFNLAGGSREAAQTIASFTSNVRDMGHASMNTAKAVEQEGKLALRFKYQLGITAEAFGDYTKGLLQDNDITAMRVRLGAKSQKGVIDSIRIRRAEYEAMGLSADAANEMSKQFSKFATKSPIERLKETIRMQAMAGMVGKGREGAELSQLRLQAQYEKDPEKRAKMMRRADKLQMQISDATVGRMDNFVGDLITSQMLIKTGMEQTFGPGGAAAQIRIAEAKAQKELTDNQVTQMNEVFQPLGAAAKVLPELFSKDKFELFSRSVDKFEAALKGPGGAIASGLATGILSGAGGIAMGVLGGAGTAGLLGKAAGMFGKGKGGMQTDMLPDAKQAGKAGKVFGKAGLKSVLKKIPLIGILAGLGFAAGRAMEGDFTGAGLEIASGAASTVPGIGTAASVGLDVALAAKDMQSSAEKVATQVEQTRKTTGVVQDKSLTPATNGILKSIQQDQKEIVNHAQNLVIEMRDMNQKFETIRDQMQNIYKINEQQFMVTTEMFELEKENLPTQTQHLKKAVKPSYTRLTNTK